jgi:hypothetical protein
VPDSTGHEIKKPQNFLEVFAARNQQKLFCLYLLSIIASLTAKVNPFQGKTGAAFH